MSNIVDDNKNTLVYNCLERIPHRFELVILASQRARMLYLGAKSSIDTIPSDSKIDVALSEISQGLCTRESIIESFKSFVTFEDDAVQNVQDVKDIKSGVSYDDFDIEDEDMDFDK
jgi:DNA-directed RNA polymerase omega subunit